MTRVQYGLTIASRFAAYAVFLVVINFSGSLFAANVDNDYRDALSVFQKRDLVSCHRAIVLLVKILEQKADHLDSQALISYAYAHEAFLLSQLGESATEYQNSADAFSKAVLAQQPQNIFARKTKLLLQLMNGNHLDVRKTLEKEVTDKETDADLVYMLAVVGDASTAGKTLSNALALNADYVWIYSDMAFRAIKMSDLAVAEKWARALEVRRPGLAEVDLIRAVIAAQKKDKQSVQSLWSDFSRKAPDFALVARFSGSKKK
jgi:hypothetical protein